MAASVSTAAMAVLFGTAGAGLASYKMDKRTVGIKEFQLESYPSKPQVHKGRLSRVVQSNVEQNIGLYWYRNSINDRY